MSDTVKKCQVDALKNSFNDLYSKYKFLCTVDTYLWDFADGDFELFSINLLFFLKSLDNDFNIIINEFSEILGEDKKHNA